MVGGNRIREFRTSRKNLCRMLDACCHTCKCVGVGARVLIYSPGIALTFLVQLGSGISLLVLHSLIVVYCQNMLITFSRYNSVDLPCNACICFCLALQDTIYTYIKYNMLIIFYVYIYIYTLPNIISNYISLVNSICMALHCSTLSVITLHSIPSQYIHYGMLQASECMRMRIL